MIYDLRFMVFGTLTLLLVHKILENSIPHPSTIQNTAHEVNDSDKSGTPSEQFIAKVDGH